MNELFRQISKTISKVTGSVWTFLTAVALILSWLATGPFFGFSDTWQLAINSTTTVVTFLMVFIIQNTQNRDSKAIHLKLDELIQANKGASLKMVDIENLPDNQLEEMLQTFKNKNEKYLVELERRRTQHAGSKKKS